MSLAAAPRAGALLLLLLAPAALADDRPEKPDLAVVHRIKAEAISRSKVMEHLFWLTDASGPRLTGSPAHRAAAERAVGWLKEWGATRPRVEPWGTFGRPWTMTRFSLNLLEPTPGPLQGVPRAFSGGTAGPVAGEAVLAPLFGPGRGGREERGDLAKIAARIRKFTQEQQGKLRGKVVLLDPPRDLSAVHDPAAKKEAATERYDEAKLAQLLAAPEPAPSLPIEWPLERFPTELGERMRLAERLPTEVVWDFAERRRKAWDPLWAFLAAEGVLAVLDCDDRGDGGTIFAESTGQWDPKSAVPPPAIVVAPEQYDRLARLLEKKQPVKVEVDLRVTFPDEAADGLNVIAELPGGRKKDEVVMIGAHLDSWTGSTGATDNAAGAAVILEAFRILKALDLPMDRTVRLALWSGEEQGLLGSRAYVREHFGDAVTMQLKPEHAKLAAYFNLDNGAGKIRGVYLQSNDMARPIFEAWLAPFRDQGAAAVTIRGTGGTDHQAFDAVGLPGFQFIQDPLDYMTRTHHSDEDAYDHVRPADLMQASAIVAAFAHAAATRPELLPRKPLPRPLPPKKATGAGQPAVAQ